MAVYCGYLLIVLAGTLLWVIVLQYLLRAYIKTGWTKAGMAKKWVAAIPSALGLGYAINAPLSISWIHLFGWFDKGMKETAYAKTIRHVLWQSCKTIVLSLLIVRIVKWDMNRRDSSVPPTEQAFGETLRHVVVKALSFVFAWSWAGLFNDLYFSVIFGSDPAGAGIFPNLYFASAYTFIALQVVPAVKTKASTLRQLGEVYANNIMLKDREAIANTATNDELLINMLGVSVGWAWTNVAAAECATDVRPLGCPKENLDVGLTIKYFCFAIMFILLTILAYHNYLESVRLADRASKVHATECGDGERFFKDADVDCSGTISRRELLHYLKVNGLDTEKFEEAFDIGVIKQQFAAMDIDRDGKLTRREWAQGFGDDTLFDSYDTDRDGMVSLEEFVQHSKANKAGQKGKSEIADDIENATGEGDEEEAVHRAASDEVGLVDLMEELREMLALLAEQAALENTGSVDILDNSEAGMEAPRPKADSKLAPAKQLRNDLFATNNMYESDTTSTSSDSDEEDQGKAHFDVEAPPARQGRTRRPISEATTTVNPVRRGVRASPSSPPTTPKKGRSKVDTVRL